MTARSRGLQAIASLTVVAMTVAWAAGCSSGGSGSGGEKGRDEMQITPSGGSAGSLDDDPDSMRAGANLFGDITEPDSSLGRYRIGLIGGAADHVDYYRFSLTEERVLDLRMRSVHQTATRTDLILENDSGQVLREVRKLGTPVLLILETLQAGTYYIRLEDDSQQSMYLLSLTTVDPSSQGTSARSAAEVADDFTAGATTNEP